MISSCTLRLYNTDDHFKSSSVTLCFKNYFTFVSICVYVGNKLLTFKIFIDLKNENHIL